MRTRVLIVWKYFRQVSHVILLTARTDCLATSCLRSSAILEVLSCSCSRALVLVLESFRARARVLSCSCSRALVLVLSCSRARARVLECSSTQVLVSCSCSSARTRSRARVFYVGRSKAHKFSFFGVLLSAPSAAAKLLLIGRVGRVCSTPSHAYILLNSKTCWHTGAWVPPLPPARVQTRSSSSSINSYNGSCVAAYAACFLQHKLWLLCRCMFCMCYHVGYVCAYLSACRSVLEPHISASSFCFAPLAAAYSYGTRRVWATAIHVWSWLRVCCVCAPCTYFHGTTAIAQQVCVDHLYECVEIAYVY